MAQAHVDKKTDRQSAGTRQGVGHQGWSSWALSLGGLFLGVMMCVSGVEAGSQDGPPPLEGGNTIGGPGLFIATNGETQQVFDTDAAQPLCLTLTGEVGTAEASFDGLGTLQVAAGHSQAVCREDKNVVELTCVEGTNCRTKWRVDTPAGEDEIQNNVVVNAPAGPPGPQGPEGPAGPQGPPGSIENATLDIISVEGVKQNITRGTFFREHFCPADRFIISAGYRVEPFDITGVHIHRLQLDPPNNKAIFWGKNTGCESGDEFCFLIEFIPFVNCAKFQ